VDIEAFRPRRPSGAGRAPSRDDLAPLVARLRTAAATPEARTGSSFDRDVGEAADAVARLDPAAGPLVMYVGKLIVSKGVDLLAAAWPLVLAREPRATLVVVGFGAYRPAFERLLAALSAGDLDAVRALAVEGRGAEGGPPAPLAHLIAFLDGLDGDARAAYVRAAAALPERVVLTGRLEHAELTGLLAQCAAQVVPSTFPEAFGMVAAEAAACGVLPVVADHSGLGEVADALAPAVPAAVRPLLRFAVGPGAVPALADRVTGWLALPEGERGRAREALVATARERFSWTGVARGVLAAARGDVDALPAPRA
jgi:glycosyltransferase involved in cell wall biosynthesis